MMSEVGEAQEDAMPPRGWLDKSGVNSENEKELYSATKDQLYEMGSCMWRVMRVFTNLAKCFCGLIYSPLWHYQRESLGLFL